jgi:ribosome-binding protein aMBF1 (putative translation factor)
LTSLPETVIFLAEFQFWRNAMKSCDLCGKAVDCRPREIDGREFDVCDRCWHPLAEKLRGKGRAKETFETLHEIELEEFEETLI